MKFSIDTVTLDPGESIIIIANDGTALFDVTKPEVKKSIFQIKHSYENHNFNGEKKT